jgi:hypothetical protein
MTTSASTQPSALNRLRIPWNTELVFFLLVEIAVGIICLVWDSVNGFNFVEVTKWTAAAYLISRGVAKASRVLDAD